MSKVKKKVRMKKSFKILIVVILIFLCGEGIYGWRRFDS